MKKVCVFSSTRADYGLLKWVMKSLQKSDAFQLCTLVAGTHFSELYGNTYKSFEEDKIPINEAVDTLLHSDNPESIVKSIGLSMISFSDSIARLNPDVAIILGDRYETLALAQALAITQVPIVHLHGGELSLGAYDDMFRHAISKLSDYHFVATQCSADRLAQMGEFPNNIFHIGALGLDTHNHNQIISLTELAIDLEIPDLGEYFLVTFHPETLSNNSEGKPLEALFNALDSFCHQKIIFTYPNADNGGLAIINAINRYCKSHPKRCFAFNTLGAKRYQSALVHAKSVIGNSSSGIIEAPYYGTPSVDIGNRQKGRAKANSVFHCEASAKGIIQAITDSINFEKVIEVKYTGGEVVNRFMETLMSLDFQKKSGFHDFK